MENLNKNIGKRLKEVRMLFNEGDWLSGDQFGHLLGVSGDKIRNYESGRSAVPVRLLAELYRRGINPVFLIAGEGSVFADNEEGRRMAHRIDGRKDRPDVVRIARGADLYEADLDHGVHRAAAGRIPYDPGKKK
jgi:hypothetical protein